MDLQELKENFNLLEDWEDKYAYLIDLGKSLEPLDESLKIEENKVIGCTSSVWLIENSDSNEESFSFSADSESAIVKGLIAVLKIIYNGKPKKEVREMDIKSIFSNLGLDSHLSTNRRNGFFSMVEKIKNIK